MILLPFHVAAGIIAVVAGFVALYVLKGGRLHRKSGMIFVSAMLVMSQWRRDGGRRRGVGAQHHRGTGDGLSGDHGARHRAAAF